MRRDVRDFLDTYWCVFLRTDGVRRAKPMVRNYWFGKAVCETQWPMRFLKKPKSLVVIVKMKTLHYYYHSFLIADKIIKTMSIKRTQYKKAYNYKHKYNISIVYKFSDRYFWHYKCGHRFCYQLFYAVSVLVKSRVLEFSSCISPNLRIESRNCFSLIYV